MLSVSKQQKQPVPFPQEKKHLKRHNIMSAMVPEQEGTAIILNLS
jgi:hypothetical protein